jgi:hypothetical protein
MRRGIPWGMNTATMISAGVFVASVVCALVASPFFAIGAAFAAFLPDVLRLLDVLRDIDEFQAEASGRASRLALVSGSFYMATVFALTATGAVEAEAHRDAWLIGLTLVLTVRYVAYAMMFWNARRGAPKVLIAFGLFWLVFVVLSEWGSWIPLAIEAAAVVGPFAAGAALVVRFPKSVGAGSVLLAIGAFVFFGMYRLFVGDLTALVVFILIPMPLASVGIGLLCRSEQKKETEDE